MALQNHDRSSWDGKTIDTGTISQRPTSNLGSIANDYLCGGYQFKTRPQTDHVRTTNREKIMRIRNSRRCLPPLLVFVTVQMLVVT